MSSDTAALPDPGNPEFWKERWRTKQTGFHEGKPNVHLQRFWPEIAIPPTARVLVPLCGASEDLAWLLAQGYQVVGIELAGEAIARFFAEHELTPSKRPITGGSAWTAGNLTIFEANLLEISDAEIGVCDALYDRAALIALPDAMRISYVACLHRWLQPGGSGLLISMTYDTTKRGGPPLSVPHHEVLAHWPGAQPLLEQPVEEERWKGIDAVETVWRLTT